MLDRGVRTLQHLVNELPPEPDLNEVVEVPECHKTFPPPHVENQEVHLSWWDHPMDDLS